MYSSAFFDQHMLAFQDPEIVSVPLEDLVLQLSVMGIRDISQFPFPSKPSIRRLQCAMRLLQSIDLVSVMQEKSPFDGEAFCGEKHDNSSDNENEGSDNERWHCESMPTETHSLE